MQIPFRVCESGLRPTIPTFTPPPFAALMIACWDADPNVRPPFKSIVESLFGSTCSALAAKAPPRCCAGHLCTRLSVVSHRCSAPLRLPRSHNSYYGSGNAVRLGSGPRHDAPRAAPERGSSASAAARTAGAAPFTRSLAQRARRCPSCFSCRSFIMHTCRRAPESRTCPQRAGHRAGVGA
jgi:hypothetical protein